MKTRDIELDFLKVIATLLIVLHHYQQVLNVRFKHFNFYGGKFYFGYLVELFFIISGICAYRWIQNINKDSSFINFYSKRIRRLLPLMVVSVLVDVILWEFFKNTFNIIVGPDNISIKNIIISSLGFQAGWGFTNPMINNPMWYISVLLLCYVIFFVTTKISRRIHMTPYILYMVMIFCGIIICTCQLHLPFFNEYSYRGYICFFSGVIGGKVLDSNWRLHNKNSLFIISLLCGSVLYFENVYQYYMVAFIIWPSIILMLRNEKFNKLICSSCWSNMAKSSFNIYVWHCPILHLLVGVIKVNDIKCYDTVLFMLISLGIIVGIGILSYIFLEKTIQNILSKCIKKVSRVKE